MAVVHTYRYYDSNSFHVTMLGSIKISNVCNEIKADAKGGQDSLSRARGSGMVYI